MFALYISLPSPPDSGGGGVLDSEQCLFIYLFFCFYQESVLAAVESMLVSVYGPLPSTEAPVSGQTDTDAQDVVRDRTEAFPQPPLDCSDVDLFGTIAQTPAKAGDPASNTSLNQTSSSSSSEDWIINKSSFDLSYVNGSLLNDDCLNTGETKGSLKENTGSFDVTPNKDSNICAESWSAGRALTDPVTGGCLEPVKLHVPSEPKEVPEAVERYRSSPSKKPSNVIVARMPKLTVYDMIGSRTVRQPLSACALFERDCTESILQEDPGAGLQDVTTAVKERWESLGEEDRKK